MNVAILDPEIWGGQVLPGQDELPSDDGEPMDSIFHDVQNAVLKQSLADAWRDRSDFGVFGNQFVYFSPRQIKHNDFRGPDIFVVMDAEPKPDRKSWVVWEEGGRLPDVVIEITSPSTAHVDRGEKMQIYSQIWRTPAYFIFDPETEELEGYGLDETYRRYVSLTKDERGDFPVAPLGLKLGLRRTRQMGIDRLFVRWLELDGTPLPTPQERADAEQARADAEQARADALEARLRELKGKLR